MKRKVVLKAMAKFLAIIISLNFALFITEEALQVVMFASWAGKDIDVSTRQALVDLYATINSTLNAMNNAFGVFLPPFYIAYRSYYLAGKKWTQAQVEAFGLHEPFVDRSWVSALFVSVFALLAAGTIIYFVIRGKEEKGGLEEFIKKE